MSTSHVYQFHVWLRGISPMIWRRLLLRSNQTLANLHYTLQISFGWSDFHWHRFRIHGQDFGVSRCGSSSFCQEAHQVCLAVALDFGVSRCGSSSFCQEAHQVCLAVALVHKSAEAFREDDRIETDPLAEATDALSREPGTTPQISEGTLSGKELGRVRPSVAGARQPDGVGHPRGISRVAGVAHGPTWSISSLFESGHSLRRGIYYAWLLVDRGGKPKACCVPWRPCSG